MFLVPFGKSKRWKRNKMTHGACWRCWGGRKGAIEKAREEGALSKVVNPVDFVVKKEELQVFLLDVRVWGWGKETCRKMLGFGRVEFYLWPWIIASVYLIIDDRCIFIIFNLSIIPVGMLWVLLLSSVYSCPQHPKRPLKRLKPCN